MKTEAFTLLMVQHRLRRLFDKTQDVSHFRVFGCQSIMYLDNPKRNKFESRALEGFLLGYRKKF